jgi:hypothetical protein
MAARRSRKTEPVRRTITRDELREALDRSSKEEGAFEEMKARFLLQPEITLDQVYEAIDRYTEALEGYQRAKALFETVMWFGPLDAETAAALAKLYTAISRHAQVERRFLRTAADYKAAKADLLRKRKSAHRNAASD